MTTTSNFRALFQNSSTFLPCFEHFLANFPAQSRHAYHRSGWPHPAGVPHLHVNRPWQRCPSNRGSNEGSKLRKAGTNSRCPFYQGVRLFMFINDHSFIALKGFYYLKITSKGFCLLSGFSQYWYQPIYFAFLCSKLVQFLFSFAFHSMNSLNGGRSKLVDRKRTGYLDFLAYLWPTFVLEPREPGAQPKWLPSWRKSIVVKCQLNRRSTRTIVVKWVLFFVRYLRMFL